MKMNKDTGERTGFIAGTERLGLENDSWLWVSVSYSNDKYGVGMIDKTILL